MGGFLIGAAGALWLGVLTSISPCPLATNVAAISYIGKRVGRPRRVLLSGAVYTAGRMAAYIAVAMLVVAGLASIPAVSNFLQQHMNRLLGPVLIVAGMMLLELIPVTVRGRGLSKGLQARADRGGLWGAGLLGVVFALSFCPVSAALFFGSLVPLAVKHGSRLLIPCLYGAGTALPVLFFAFIIAFSAHRISRAFGLLQRFEAWARRITGVLFILVGVYYCLAYIFGVLRFFGG